jgi:hypothetical protein
LRVAFRFPNYNSALIIISPMSTTFPGHLIPLPTTITKLYLLLDTHKEAPHLQFPPTSLNEPIFSSVAFRQEAELAQLG